MTVTSELVLPDWLTVGGNVAEFAYGRGRQNQVKLSTITKIGKRDVVLENGARYNVQRLQRSVGGTYGTVWYLRPRTDPQVREAYEAGRRRHVAATVTSLLNDWAERGDPALLGSALFHLNSHYEPDASGVRR